MTDIKQIKKDVANLEKVATPQSISWYATVSVSPARLRRILDFVEKNLPVDPLPTKPGTVVRGLYGAGPVMAVRDDNSWAVTWLTRFGTTNGQFRRGHDEFELTDWTVIYSPGTSDNEFDSLDITDSDI